MIELTTLPSRIKPAIGYVIVEVPYLTRTTRNGHELSLVADTTVGDYSVRSGTILSCGSTDIPLHNYNFDSPLQVSQGDKVWWIPNAVSQINTAEDEQHRILKYKERIFVTIPYKSLVMKLQAGEYVGLNDYVISEAVEEDSGYITENGPDGLIHKVVAKPLPGITYRQSGKQDAEVPIDVEVGSIVLLRQGRRMFLEGGEDISLPGKWTAFQSRMIVARAE